jgi:hypothetical protein
MFRTFLGDFTPDRLDSRSLQSLWEWKNRVLLEEYYIFNVAIITWVHYLGPPGPSPSQILGTSSRFSEDFLARERDPLGRIP